MEEDLTMIKEICKILLCAFLLSFCTCKTIWINTSKDNDSIGATNVGQLQITSMDLGSWQQAGFNEYSSVGLWGPIDGAAQTYISQGVIEAAIQDLNGPSGKF